MSNQHVQIPAWDRFWPKVLVGDGCWSWTASLDTGGYGLFNSERRKHRAHRFAYELLRGSIPEGMTLDHLCRNRACVNPWHLEPVTQRENTLRSPVAPTAVNAAKTHCINGHPFDEVNTLVRFDGKRQCRACRRDWDRDYKRKIRSEP